MLRPLVVGLDGSPESLAAADWAAREALRREIPVELLQAWPRERGDHAAVPGNRSAERWARDMLRRTETELRTFHPGLKVTSAQVPDSPTAVLSSAAKDAEMLVLGSRGLGTLTGFLLGSVSQEVLGRAGRPVVLVRAGARAADEHLPDAGGRPSAETPLREVLLGLDTSHECDAVAAFAFEAAARRAAPLTVVHTWNLYRTYGYAASPLSASLAEELEAEESRLLAVALASWREKYPGVTVAEQLVVGSAAQVLTEAARRAGLAVVGRRPRRGVGTHVGPVTHAVVHHAPCPVAVVPCG